MTIQPDDLASASITGSLSYLRKQQADAERLKSTPLTAYQRQEVDMQWLDTQIATIAPKNRMGHRPISASEVFYHRTSGRTSDKDIYDDWLEETLWLMRMEHKSPSPAKETIKLFDVCWLMGWGAVAGAALMYAVLYCMSMGGVK